MTDAEEFICSTYSEIEELSCSNTSRVSSVRSALDGKMYIKRQIPGNHLAVYKTLKTLHTDGIPTIHELIFDGNTIVFEEYLEGTSLAKISVGDNFFTELMLGILSLLELIHSQNIIHRDIKEENFILTSSNRLVLIDFAIANLRSEHSSSESDILGTVGYAAPEQFTGVCDDPRSDIYSFGKLCLSIMKRCQTLSPSTQTLWQSIAEKATKHNLDQRFQNVKEILTLASSPNFFFGSDRERLLSFPHTSAPTCMQLKKGEEKTVTHATWGKITLRDNDGKVSLFSHEVLTVFFAIPTGYLTADYTIELTFLSHTILITRKFYHKGVGPSGFTVESNPFYELCEIQQQTDGTFFAKNYYQSLCGFSVLGEEECILDKESLRSFPL